MVGKDTWLWWHPTGGTDPAIGSTIILMFSFLVGRFYYDKSTKTLYKIST